MATDEKEAVTTVDTQSTTQDKQTNVDINANTNTNADDAEQAGNDTPNDEDEYPHGLRLGLIITAIMVTMFLVALDRLIIATAVPQITDDFHSVDDIGWYGSAYLLGTCGFQLLFGKLYQVYSVKLVFFCAVLLFEVGSVVCGAAPTSVAFIVGRALAGVGSAGIFAGTIVIMVYSVPLRRRPKYQGLFGAVFGVASVLGPLLGGAFTTNVTWRWCFYINLPFGGVAMALVLWLLHVPDRPSQHATTRQKMAQLDGPGTCVFLPGVVCLLLALQWGGAHYPWSDRRVIALLVVAGVLLAAFVAIQFWRPETATVPPRIMTRRSIWSSFWATFFVGAEMMLFVYYLPIWFQAIQGVNAVTSGIRTLPLVLAMVVGSMLTGVLTNVVGYYTPFMIAGAVFSTIGGGLLTTLQLDTPQPQWIGYQFLYGWGVGHNFQAPNLAAQTVLPRQDVSIGTSVMMFGNMLGGAVFVAVAQNILDSELIRRLRRIPAFGDPKSILDSGATSLTNLPPDVKPAVLAAYNESLRQVFRAGLVLVCLVLPGALLMEWLSIRRHEVKEDLMPPKEENPKVEKKEQEQEQEQDQDQGNKDSSEKAAPSATVDNSPDSITPVDSEKSTEKHH